MPAIDTASGPIREEDITGQPSTLSNPNMGVAAPQVQTPSRTPGGVPAIPMLQLPPEKTGLEKFGDILLGLSDIAAAYSGPSGQMIASRNQQIREEKRMARVSSEVQAITGMVSQALASGNPEILAKTVEQLAKVKNLQPETIKSLQEWQLKLADKVGEMQGDMAIGEALSALPMEEARVAARILKNNPRVKPRDVIDMYKAGMLTDPAVANRRKIEQVKQVMNELTRVQGGGSNVGGLLAPQWTANVSKEGEISFQQHQITPDLQKAMIAVSALGVTPERFPKEFQQLVGEFLYAQAQRAEMQDVAMDDLMRRAAQLVQTGKLQESAFSNRLDQLNNDPAMVAHKTDQLLRDQLTGQLPPGITVRSLYDRARQLRAEQIRLETQMREEAQREYGQLPQTLRQSYEYHTQVIASVQALRNNFKDNEIIEFAGWLNQPYNRMKAYLSTLGGGEKQKQWAERFFQFESLINNLKNLVFERGGKQLTPFEASVVFSIFPTGAELGGGQQLLTKIKALEAFATAGRKTIVDVQKTAPRNLDMLRLEDMLTEALKKQGFGARQVVATPEVESAIKKQFGNSVKAVEAIPWLIEKGYARSREEAIGLLMNMQSKKR